MRILDIVNTVIKVVRPRINGFELLGIKRDEEGYMIYEYKRVKNYECDSKDFILAEKQYLGFNRMKTHRNSSVFAYAAPGSSILKTLIEPNILQANASFIVPEHDNKLSENYKDFLKEKGYVVKTVDFCFNLSDTSNIQTHYNPFCYIKEEKDIIGLVDVIFEKTESTSEYDADPFHPVPEKALLQALVLALWTYHPTEEQTFCNVLDFLNKTSGVNGVELTWLDNYFENIRKKDTESIAAQQYEMFKTCAGEKIERNIVSLAVRLQMFNLITVKEMTSKDTLQLEKIFTEKTAVFVNLSADGLGFNLLAPILYHQVLSMMERGSKRAQNTHCILYMNRDVIANSFSFAHLFNIIDTNRNSVIFYTEQMSGIRKTSSAVYNIFLNCDTIMIYSCKDKSDAEILTHYFSSNVSNEISSEKNDILFAHEIMTMKDEECMGKIRGYKFFKAKKYNIEEHPNYFEA